MKTNPTDQSDRLTKREYFATHAVTDGFTFTTESSASEFLGYKVDFKSIEGSLNAAMDIDAKIRVMKADALINALNK